MKLVLRCPVCGEEYITTQSDLASTKTWLAKHILEKHMDWLVKWYMEHPKSWSYVKREVKKIMQPDTPVGAALDGTVYTVGELGEELRRKLETASAASELLDTLKKIRKGTSVLGGIQAGVLETWLARYVVDKMMREGELVPEPFKGEAQLKKLASEIARKIKQAGAKQVLIVYGWGAETILTGLGPDFDKKLNKEIREAAKNYLDVLFDELPAALSRRRIDVRYMLLEENEAAELQKHPDPIAYLYKMLEH